ncbi:MAG: di-heme oxidoredictase family protein [Pseudomonadota bacterium]
MRPGGQYLTFAPQARPGRAYLAAFDPSDRLQRGEEIYYRDWLETGNAVGPGFDHTSCNGCHLETAIQGPAHAQTLIAQPASESGRYWYGAQISTHVVNEDDAEAIVRVTQNTQPIAFADGSRQQLSWQTGSVITNDGHDEPVKFRVAPLLFGWGLIEQTDPEYIVHFNDPDDRNADGISGRMGTKHGKWAFLGWKNTQTSLRTQIGAALHNDIGISNDTTCGDNCTPEIEPHELDALTEYVRHLGVPDRRTDFEMRGQNLFGFANCTGCHVPVILTKATTDLPFAQQLLWPFTDLMLHDMGHGLADPGEHTEAREWRTAPLWGLGVIEARYPRRGFLHDGRADSIEEAILWHGGEAAASRDYYLALSLADRNALLAFVRSL